MELLTVVPVELRDANAFVMNHHRHHKPVQGHRFSIGLKDQSGKLVAVCIVGRPVARLAGHPTEVLEVTRMCSDGTKNACSKLLSAAARAGQSIGYKKIQTYTLESESGTSLVACGWVRVGVCGGGQWKHSDGKERRTDQPTCKKVRWEKVLNG